MKENQRKIGIMGGAFDPIHYGHLLIAENAAAQYGLDQVVFMPTGQSPHKAKRHITDASYRCEMIRQAIADNPKFCLSTLELDLSGTNYTYRTLEHWKEQHPKDKLYFIMGGDSLKDFETWRYPDRILQAAYLLAAIRDDVEGTVFQEQIAYLRERYQTEYIFALNTPNFAVSSHRIRSLTEQGQTIRYMVPEPVREYILAHGLYDRKTGMNNNETIRD